jgi:hypothetical protein
VEGASGRVIFARLSQINAAADNIDDIHPVQQVIDKTLWNFAGHSFPEK